MSVESTDTKGVFKVGCLCRSIHWDTAKGHDLIVRCSRCNTSNRIPAVLSYAQPENGNLQIERRDY